MTVTSSGLQAVTQAKNKISPGKIPKGPTVLKKPACQE
jgi:hypothetical protein